MAPKKFNSLFVAVVALLVLAAPPCPAVEARKYVGVNKWCRTSDNRRLCTRMVMNATTLHEASANAVKTTLALAKRVQTLVPLLKPVIRDLERQSQESIMDTCNEDFSGRIDDLEDCVNAIEANDIGTVTSKLSAAYSSDCMDALDQFGVECPFAKAVKALEKHVDNCLAVVQQI